MSNIIEFENTRDRYLKIDDNIIVKLRDYAPGMSIMEFIDVHGNIIDLPTGFALYNVTYDYNGPRFKTVVPLAHKYFYVLVHKFSYEFVYKQKMYNLYNKRQWDSNVEWEDLQYGTN